VRDTGNLFLKHGGRDLGKEFLVKLQIGEKQNKSRKKRRTKNEGLKVRPIGAQRN